MKKYFIFLTLFSATNVVHASAIVSKPYERLCHINDVIYSCKITHSTGAMNGGFAESYEFELAQDKRYAAYITSKVNHLADDNGMINWVDMDTKAITTVRLEGKPAQQEINKSLTCFVNEDNKICANLSWLF